MKIRVDVDSCSGQARCAAVAGDIYKLDDVGYNATDELDVDEASITLACRGALACPEGAITILDDDGNELSEQELRKLARVKG
jgi:ferredoxin